MTATRPRPPYGQWSEAGRKVLIIGQDEAQWMGIGRIDEALWLLGILRQQLPITARLNQAGLMTSNCRESIKVQLHVPENPSLVMGELGLTDRAKDVLRAATKYASRNSPSIRPEHIARALFDLREGAAYETLVNTIGPFARNSIRDEIDRGEFSSTIRTRQFETDLDRDSIEEVEDKIQQMQLELRQRRRMPFR